MSTLAQATLRTANDFLSIARENIPSPQAVGVAVIQAKAIATEQFPKVANAILTTAKDHPYSAGLATTGLAIVTAPVVISAPALLLTGFGSTGIGAGTIAASAQAGIGNVAAGSLIATLQSAGAGGAGLMVVNGVVQVVGGIVAAAGPGLAYLKSKW